MLLLTDLASDAPRRLPGDRRAGRIPRPEAYRPVRQAEPEGQPELEQHLDALLQGQVEALPLRTRRAGRGQSGSCGAWHTNTSTRLQRVNVFITSVGRVQCVWCLLIGQPVAQFQRTRSSYSDPLIPIPPP